MPYIGNKKILVARKNGNPFLIEKAAKYYEVYSITYNLNGGGYILTPAADYTTVFREGEKIILPDAHREYTGVKYTSAAKYEFAGWCFDAECKELATPAAVSSSGENITLYAKWIVQLESSINKNFVRYTSHAGNFGNAIIDNNGYITFSFYGNPSTTEFVTNSAGASEKRDEMFRIRNKYMLPEIVLFDVYGKDITTNGAVMAKFGDTLDMVCHYDFENRKLTVKYYANGIYKKTITWSISGDALNVNNYNYTQYALDSNGKVIEINYPWQIHSCNFSHYGGTPYSLKEVKVYAGDIMPRQLT